MSTPETTTLLYSILQVYPDALPGDYALPDGVGLIDNEDPTLATRLTLSKITDDPDTTDLLQALVTGDAVRIEDQIPGNGWAEFTVGEVIIATAFVQLGVTETDSLGPVGTTGNPYYVTVPTHAEPPEPPEPEPPATYAPVEELARILLIPNPTPAQSAAMTRVLTAAATEITAYLGLAAPLTEPYPALVVEVNLERAVEHWKQEQSPFGIVVLGGELPPGHAGQNAWRRHARTLLPLKRSWGVG
jgi:hypothetical protein